eukprot:g17403.t1
MKTLWDLVLLPLWEWISKITPGVVKRGNNLTMDAIEKRAGGMPSTMQMMSGKVAQGFSSKARMALALKVICNYPKPTQLAVFPKSAREMLQAAIDLMDAIETQQIPERELWMLWFAMVQEEVGLSEAQLAEAWQGYAFIYPPLPQEWQTELTFTGARQAPVQDDHGSVAGGASNVGRQHQQQHFGGHGRGKGYGGHGGYGVGNGMKGHGKKGKMKGMGKKGKAAKSVPGATGGARSSSSSSHYGSASSAWGGDDYGGGGHGGYNSHWEDHETSWSPQSESVFGGGWNDDDVGANYNYGGFEGTPRASDLLW